MKLIIGKHTVLIDKSDFARISRLSWWIQKNRNTHYVQCGTTGLRGMLMHRLLLDARLTDQVDHRNGNGLDNRRKNLRLATRSQNCCNARRRKDATLPYRGIKLDKRDGKYHARISINGKRKHLGTFSDPISAALAFDRAAKVRGEFAQLNFPEV